MRQITVHVAMGFSEKESRYIPLGIFKDYQLALNFIKIARAKSGKKFHLIVSKIATDI